MKYKKGDILVDPRDGDLLEYLGRGYVKWITFQGVTDHAYIDERIKIKEMYLSEEFRKLSPLEKML